MSSVVVERQATYTVSPEIALVALAEAEEQLADAAEHMRHRAQSIKLLLGSIAFTAAAMLCSPDDVVAQSARDTLRPVGHMMQEFVSAVSEHSTEGS